MQKGQATVELHPFKRIVGIDPSAKMLEGARKYVKETLGDVKSIAEEQFQFIQSPAEKLDCLEDGTVDMVVSGNSLRL